MHRNSILRIICIDPVCTELHLYRGDDNHLAYHEVDFVQLGAQHAYALFDLPGFLRQCSDAAADAAEAARIGVLLATRILGPKIMPLLYADPTPRPLLIELPTASPQPLVRVPWDLARPCHGQPTLCERNLRMVFKH